MRRREQKIARSLARHVILILVLNFVWQNQRKKRNILVLSVMQPLDGVSRDDGYREPAIIKFYDFTKGGTDVVDQLNDCHTYQSQVFTWDAVALLYMLDTI